MSERRPEEARPPGGDPLRASMSGWFVQLAALLWPRALLEKLEAALGERLETYQVDFSRW